MSFKLATGLLTIFCLAAFSAPADAVDLCVTPTSMPTCAPAETYSFDETGLAAALTKAAPGNSPGSDRILIDAGTITVTTAKTYSSAEELDMVGAGAGQTILDTSANGLTLLSLTANQATSSVKDLTVRFTGSTAGPLYGIAINGGTLENVAVVDDSTYNGVQAVQLAGGATLKNSVITLNSSSDIGVSATSGNANVTGATITGSNGGTGVNMSASSYAVDHTAIRGLARGLTIDSGTLAVSDSLVDLGANANGRGINIANDNSGSAAITLDADRVTVVGSGSGQTGVWLQGNLASEDALATVDNSLIYMTHPSAVDVNCLQDDPGTVVYTLTDTAFNDIAVTMDPGGCGQSVSNQIDTATNAPVFVDAPNGDYRPTWDSPLVDAGGDGSLLATNATDLDGQTRLKDGDNDATTALDVGAFEYQRKSPAIATAAASKSTPAPGEIVSFSGIASDPEGEPIEYQWSVDGGPPVAGASINTSFATVGVHAAVLTVTDAAGAFASAAVAVNVTGQTSVSDPFSLVISARPTRAFNRSNKRFRLNPAARQPYLLVNSQGAGKTKLTLERRTTGVKRSGRCRQGTGRPRCARYVKVRGLQNLNLPPGPHRITFGGRFNGRLLPKGTYRLTLIPSGGFTAPTPVRTTIELG